MQKSQNVVIRRIISDPHFTMRKSRGYLPEVAHSEFTHICTKYNYIYVSLIHEICNWDWVCLPFVYIKRIVKLDLK